MNGLILYPLLIIFLLGAFCQLLNISAIDMSYNGTLASMNTTGNQTLNGTTQELSQQQQSSSFAVDMTTGLIALIIGLVAVGVVAGIRVLGSGLSEFSVNLIYKAVVYYGLWGMFSALAIDGFISIPFFGAFFWLGLTLVYSLGFFQSIGKGEGQ